MRAYLHRKYKFSASHRLHCAALSEERNRVVYGKCNNPHGHGHNYVLEITIAGEVDTTTGMVMDLATLDAMVQQNVVSRFALSNLNQDEEFREAVPTTENLTTVIYKLLHSALPANCLHRVHIEETSNNSFAYDGN